MLKIPYGISDFPDMPTEHYYYVDRTSYIEKLENRGEKTFLFVRPRRFGKSLFVSMLRHYYGVEYKADFERYFSSYYIGQHPTPKVNSYLVLQLDFSGIDTSNPKDLKQDFLVAVQQSALNFLSAYATYFKEKDKEELMNYKNPHSLIRALLNKTARNAKGKSVYLLIDEYDHFTNELLAFNFQKFRSTVGRNGWVRKFYEVLKIANGQGIIDRMFITGVSPITLDSLTSGFNMATNISTDASFNEMMGFTEAEVIQILTIIGIPEIKIDSVLRDLKFWYNGYLFNHNGQFRVYNPDMVLYFAKHYHYFNDYPNDLLDENIGSDYGKIDKLFQINDSKAENLETLRELIEHERVKARLVKRYSFDLPWSRNDFISLLFYTGILTIEENDLDEHIFVMPNFVIKQLYFQYFNQSLIADTQIAPRAIDLTDKIKTLAQKNDFQPLVELTQNVIAQLGVEDKAHFNETSLKAIFASFFYQVSYYNIFSELEVRKSPTKKGRVDLLLTRRAPFKPKYQFVFELKYIRNKKRNTFDTIKEEAIIQLEQYLQNDDTLKNLDNLKAYVIIFIGHEAEVIPV